MATVKLTYLQKHTVSSVKMVYASALMQMHDNVNSGIAVHRRRVMSRKFRVQNPRVHVAF